MHPSPLPLGGDHLWEGPLMLVLISYNQNAERNIKAAQRKIRIVSLIRQNLRLFLEFNQWKDMCCVSLSEFFIDIFSKLQNFRKFQNWQNKEFKKRYNKYGKYFRKFCNFEKSVNSIWAQYQTKSQTCYIVLVVFHT